MMGHDQTRSVLSNLSPADNAGFVELASVASAWAWLDALPLPAVTEALPLDAARGRILAADISFDHARPLPLRAAINGYAVRAATCVGASAYNPILLTLLPPGCDALPETAACPIATGWTLPTGADAVLPLDAAQPDQARSLEVLDAVPPGAGIETPPPRLHLPAGRCLRPQDLGCLAAAGVSNVAVRRQPSVALLVPGAKSGPDTLTPTLHALLERDGAVPILLPAAEPAALLAALTGPAIATCDLVVVAGRAGTGIDDFVPAQMLAAGGNIVLYGLALRPGGSTGLASLPRNRNPLPLVLLPGEPLGCLTAYDLVASRVVCRFARRAPDLSYPVANFPLARKIVSGLGSLDVVPVQLVGDTAEPIGTDTGLAGAAMADGFVLVTEGSEGYPAGARVPVHLYGQPMQCDLS